MPGPLGFLGGAFDFSSVAEDEFNDWYDTEHIPERLRIRGFLNAVRWIGAANPRLSLAIYDLESLEILRKPEYRSVSPDNFSPWSRRILLERCRRLCRFNCVQMGSSDQVAPNDAPAMLLFAVNVATELEPELEDWYECEHIPRLASVPGVRSARWFRTPGNTPGSSSHRYVSTYHLESLEVCESPAWRRAAFTERTRKLAAYMRDILRLELNRYVRR